MTQREQRAAAKVIVIGKMQPGPFTVVGGRRVLLSPARMKVGRYLKGFGARTVNVQTGAQASHGQIVMEEDGILPAVGQRWEILSSSRHVPLRTSVCLGSRQLAAAPTGSRHLVDRATSYGVEIQAGYDRRGEPSLGANFLPDGSLAKPRWAICSPPALSICTAVKSSAQFLDPGPTPTGNVFQASAPYEGRTYTARTATWSGRVHATRPPWLQGPARAGARVRPRRATWRGGWRAVPGYQLKGGIGSGGHAPDFDSLSVEACRTRSGKHCVNLTPQGQRWDFVQQPVTVTGRLVGWFLFAFDEHFAADTAFAEPGYPRPGDIPALKPSATVARSAGVGPVRG